jgi:hypothetical protein
MRFVLLVAENVSGSPLGEVAVTGTINDLPAGMLALGMESIVGAPQMEDEAAATQTTIQQNKRRIMDYDKIVNPTCGAPKGNSK